MAMNTENDTYDLYVNNIGNMGIGAVVAGSGQIVLSRGIHLQSTESAAD